MATLLREVDVTHYTPDLHILMLFISATQWSIDYPFPEPNHVSYSYLVGSTSLIIFVITP